MPAGDSETHEDPSSFFNNDDDDTPADNQQPAPKRRRGAAFSEMQVEQMERAYSHDELTTPQQRENMARLITGLHGAREVTSHNVTTWLNNRKRKKQRADAD